MFSIINKSILAVTFVACVAQVVYWFGRVPEIMPSHFDTQGNVDGEMGKTAFFVMMSLVNVIFLIGFPILGGLLKKIPNSLINFPNKDYWLAPVRRDETLRFNREFMTAIGWLTSWLMISCIHLSCMVAIGSRQGIGPEFFWMVGAYLVAVFGSIAFLYWKFRVPADGAELLPR